MVSFVDWIDDLRYERRLRKQNRQAAAKGAPGANTGAVKNKTEVASTRRAACRSPLAVWYQVRGNAWR